jgi:prepilin-type processing-associated H-X9-DG protein
MYCSDNNGYFPSGDNSVAGRVGMGDRLSLGVRTSSNRAARSQPNSAQVARNGGPSPTSWAAAVDVQEEASEPEQLVSTCREVTRSRVPPRNTLAETNVGTGNIPVFADTMWRGGGPFGSGNKLDPPQYNGEWINAGAEMRHFAIDRHNGSINHLFLDWSVRSVGVKELWTLKWHKDFDTRGRFTKAGGAQPSDWPEWMRSFKDY